jgi:tRNA/tmRNA/rRNA uracil-C5-methylase (TrmA/RlmC/RlmD family)
VPARSAAGRAAAPDAGPARPAGLHCTHRPPCPGCPRFGEPGIAPDGRAALEALARRHGLPGLRVVSGASTAFRLRARLAIRGRLGAPRVGLFEADSHRVVHVPNCVVQHPLINRVAGVVRRALVDANVPSYSDEAHAGLARYLQVVVERDSQCAQVVLVANAPTPEPLRACLDLVRERLGADLHSLWFNAQDEPVNRILGPEFVHWCGPEAVVERFGGPAVHYPPGAFGQSNLEIAARIVEHVRELVPEGATVAEFYGGVGAIGLSLLPRVRALRINEIGAASLRGLQLGIDALDAPERAKVQVVAGRAGEALPAAEGAGVVVADPPRKGLDPELLERLCERPPERFVYVSCGLESLLAEAARLTDSGRLRLRSLTAFNLMPYTAHVETVAGFERA